MNLSEEDDRKAVEWLRSRCRKIRCSACGGKAFQNAGLVATSSVPIKIHGEAIAFVAFSCKDCGNTLFFQASAVLGREP